MEIANNYRRPREMRQWRFSKELKPDSRINKRLISNSLWRDSRYSGTLVQLIALLVLKRNWIHIYCLLCNGVPPHAYLANQTVADVFDSPKILTYWMKFAESPITNTRVKQNRDETRLWEPRQFAFRNFSL